MLYRKFGRTGEDVSILGFGCMRFPVIDGKEDRIDEEQATRMIEYAIEKGVNYFDTAYPYHEGKSEPFVGKVLSNGYREKVFLATKLPLWLVEKREDMDRFLDEQLRRLQTDYFDFYLMHGFTRGHWEKMKELGMFDFIESALSSGKIKYIGFSFHDDITVFKEIVDGYDWDFCMIQYNFMDENYQAGKEGLLYAAEKGLGVAIMEPLRGGSLVQVPDDVQLIWDSADVKRTPVNWCLQYLWDQPQVSIVLSGMSNFEQLEQNIAYAEEGIAGGLSEKEHELIGKVREVYLEKTEVNCTSCKYCLPCPSGVNIPAAFTYLNSASMYGNLEKARHHYEMFVPPEERASRCIECGACEEKCPQHISIQEMLKHASKVLEN
ncbi:aldo/keto reductase [Methanococcoides methylutens]|uniref:Aldo/keto reductase n=1 Tax=Methanococcoides methylutens MM1 TaxID=1434104 RepID=A0A0E3STJ7_METMT|nr:aldo/keto reductase [Methanococcoides methylutens]AKB86002.1 Aldo/keto reductase [Methanococcoides methylutens MM1]